MTLKQVIILRTDLDMGKGKLCAQGAHASIESFLKAKSKNANMAQEWLNSGMPKVVLKVDNEKELIQLFEQAKREVPASLITDAGRTQVEPGSKTAVGLGPFDEKVLDRYTGHLKLL